MTEQDIQRLKIAGYLEFLCDSTLAEPIDLSFAIGRKFFNCGASDP
jgi:hypothetical protein